MIKLVSCCVLFSYSTYNDCYYAAFEGNLTVLFHAEESELANMIITVASQSTTFTTTGTYYLNSTSVTIHFISSRLSQMLILLLIIVGVCAGSQSSTRLLLHYIFTTICTPCNLFFRNWTVRTRSIHMSHSFFIQYDIFQLMHSTFC